MVHRVSSAPRTKGTEMYFSILITCLAVVWGTPATLLGQAGGGSLPRRGFLGIALGADANGDVTAISIVGGSTAAALGIQPGDVIEMVDDVDIRTPTDVTTLIGQKRAGESISIRLSREGRRQTLSAVVKSCPRERMDHATVEYASVEVTEGVRLRTLVSVPEYASRRLPAVMLIQGGGCGSIDAPLNTTQGQPGLIHAIGSHGFVTMRVEKSGVGDSEGPPCNSIGYQQELAGYRAALQALESHPAVDPNRVFLLGISLGGVFAPILAGDGRIAGVIVFGTLAAPPPPFPGRSQRFFQEFAAVDVLAAWRAIDTPVLVIHGEYDAVTTETDHARIASAVNDAHPGRAKHVELEKLDHCFTRHASKRASVDNCGGGEATSALSDAILEFLREYS
jgi:uncharacterized protein